MVSAENIRVEGASARARPPAFYGRKDHEWVIGENQAAEIRLVVAHNGSLS